MKVISQSTKDQADVVNLFWAKILNNDIDVKKYVNAQTLKHSIGYLFGDFAAIQESMGAQANLGKVNSAGVVADYLELSPAAQADLNAACQLLPSWRDLCASGGEIDIHKAQEEMFFIDCLMKEISNNPISASLDGKHKIYRAGDMGIKVEQSVFKAVMAIESIELMVFDSHNKTSEVAVAVSSQIVRDRARALLLFLKSSSPEPKRKATNLGL